MSERPISEEQLQSIGSENMTVQQENASALREKRVEKVGADKSNKIELKTGTGWREMKGSIGNKIFTIREKGPDGHSDEIRYEGEVRGSSEVIWLKPKEAEEIFKRYIDVTDNELALLESLAARSLHEASKQYEHDQVVKELLGKTETGKTE